MYTMNHLPPAFSSYFSELTEADLLVVFANFKVEKITINNLFTLAGRQRARLSSVQSGVLRIYALDEDGQEITLCLAIPNSLVTKIATFFFKKANRWSIQALNEVELLTLNEADCLRLR